MPLEVLDLRREFVLPDALERHAGWDRPELAKPLHDVQRILGDVRADGDEALIAYTERFDGVELTPPSLRVEPEERDLAAKRVPESLTAALHSAADNVRAFHTAQRPEDWTMERGGAVVGQVFRPIRRVGLYAPGGRGAYPSTVLMTAIPAQVAGCPEIVLCTPPDEHGAPSDVLMAAAQVAGIDEIYRVGGAQAIGAMAYGTETIRAVDKIFGPGNIWVTLAKREVFGTVGIDGLFGPSESVVVADDDAKPVLAAAELLTQAEHDPEAASILITTSEDVMSATLAAVEQGSRQLPRSKDIREALATHGLAILVRNLEQAAAVVDHLAPEHLCVQVADPGAFLDSVNVSGAVLIGEETPASLSDYCAGPSHVLPTARTARFQSGLSVRDFLVAINTVRYDRAALEREAPIADTLAAAEDLQAHRDALRVRLEDG